ncbi:uncharacterized protein ARMOST_21006 [Armillaria ostoyae]|uniref:Uncharacterized protein n=1 Tax=Armillaria ostoyae TaxID=47428 RepID=A0A284S905_ARMOS|nr:uncharacterized protein ARMOST_21006 [Armillaria ostoyae]
MLNQRALSWPYLKRDVGLDADTRIRATHSLLWMRESGTGAAMQTESGFGIYITADERFGSFTQGLLSSSTFTQGMLRNRHRCWISTGSYRLLLSYPFASTLSLWTSIGPEPAFHERASELAALFGVLRYSDCQSQYTNKQIFHGCKDDAETGLFFPLPLLSLRQCFISLTAALPNRLLLPLKEDREPGIRCYRRCCRERLLRRLDRRIIPIVVVIFISTSAAAEGLEAAIPTPTPHFSRTWVWSHNYDYGCVPELHHGALSASLKAPLTQGSRLTWSSSLWRSLHISLLSAAVPLGASFSGYITYGMSLLNDLSNNDRTLAILRMKQESSKPVGCNKLTWDGAKSILKDGRLEGRHQFLCVDTEHMAFRAGDCQWSGISEVGSTLRSWLP